MPLLIWSIHALALWLWHLPPLYQAALRNPLMHDLQHLSFFLGGCLFWAILFGPKGMRLNGAVSVLLLFTTSLHATALGALMALAPRPWYPAYGERALAWGWSAHEDRALCANPLTPEACGSDGAPRRFPCFAGGADRSTVPQASRQSMDAPS